MYRQTENFGSVDKMGSVDNGTSREPKRKVKSERYWPYENESVELGGINIEWLSEEEKSDWIIRTFNLSKDGSERKIKHFHYTSWPDHGAPETSQSIVRFATKFRLYENKDGASNKPTLVHCSAGVGRTGAFIAVDYLLQHVKTHDYVDIFGLVHKMRLQRVFMVQTEKQYIFLHKMVQELIIQNFEINEDEDETLYENVVNTIYQNIPPKTSIYENVNALKQ